MAGPIRIPSGREPDLIEVNINYPSGPKYEVSLLNHADTHLLEGVISLLKVALTRADAADEHRQGVPPQRVLQQPREL